MRLNSKSKGRKNDKEFYKEICTGGKEAPVCIVFDEYKTFLHYYLRGQKGKNKTSRKSLRIEKYAEFIRYVQEIFGIGLNINYESFRTDYKRLYLHDDLRYYASKGIIRHRHIRSWDKISPLIVGEANSVEEIDVYWKLAGGKKKTYQK